MRSVLHTPTQRLAEAEQLITSQSFLKVSSILSGTVQTTSDCVLFTDKIQEYTSPAGWERGRKTDIPSPQLNELMLHLTGPAM
jgi:hypothetical protein